MPLDAQYFSPDAARLKADYSPWQRGEESAAQQRMAAAALLVDALNRRADRSERKTAREEERLVQFDRDVANRQFYSSESDKDRAFRFGERVADNQARDARSVSDFKDDVAKMQEESRLRVAEAEQIAKIEEKRRAEKQRQFNEATRLAKMAQYDTRFTPLEEVKGATLDTYMDELLAQGPNLAAYIGAQREGPKAEGLLKQATQKINVRYYNKAKGQSLAETISQRAGIDPDISSAAIESLYSGLPTDLDEAMKPHVEAFNKARGIEAPVRQQTQTGALEAKTSAGTLTTGQRVDVDAFQADEAGRIPLSGDSLGQIGLQIQDIVPGAGQMASGFENELKGYQLKITDDGGNPRVELVGDLNKPFGKALNAAFSTQAMQDRLLGRIAGGPGNSPGDMETMGAELRRRYTGGVRAPRAAPQQTAPPQKTQPRGPELFPGAGASPAAQKANEWLFGTTPQ